MIIKQKWIIIIMLFANISCSQNKKVDLAINRWINGWVDETIEMRKIYHTKLNSIQPVEIKSDKDYLNVNLIKKRKEVLEQLLKIELWKFDKSNEINDRWYNKIDSLLSKSVSKEQISFLKDYITKGNNLVNDFRQVSNNYFNSQILFTNFLLERNCNLKSSDELEYNNLTLNVENCSKIYTDEVNNLYNNYLHRVKEFNLHFKNDQIDKLIDIIPDGVLNK
jgi:hypothetical protein